MTDARVALRFALTSLAVWRVAHLLAEEDGPADAVVRLRSRMGEGTLGELMDCFYCLSVWVAAPASLVVTRRRRDLPLAWLALSGAACLLERTTREADAAGADVTREEGADDGLLRPEEEGLESEPSHAGEPARSVDATERATLTVAGSEAR